MAADVIIIGWVKGWNSIARGQNFQINGIPKSKSVVIGDDLWA